MTKPTDPFGPDPFGNSWMDMAKAAESMLAALEPHVAPLGFNTYSVKLRGQVVRIALPADLSDSEVTQLQAVLGKIAAKQRAL